MSKKEPERFSIKFNVDDPTHQTVIKLLNQLSPRKKAQYIANAVYHYTNCPESISTIQHSTISQSSIENIVKNIIEKYSREDLSENTQSFSHVSSSINTTPTSEKQNDGLDTETLAAISNSLAAFNNL